MRKFKSGNKPVVDGSLTFYVGKGKNNRVLEHWKNAAEKPGKLHEKEIRKILDTGKYPDIKILAYNLDKSKEDRYSIAERVLQDAFGIQLAWDNASGVDRLMEKENILLQRREDSASSRPLSLESALAKAENRGEIDRDWLNLFANTEGKPILLVGLMKLFRSDFLTSELREMSRMYWNLKKYSSTKLPELLEGDGYLLAWTSKLNNHPMIVGAWSISKKPKFHKGYGRYEFFAEFDKEIQKKMIGLRLRGNGTNWQGQSIFVPKMTGSK